MWINRAQYDSMLRDGASLSAQVESYKQQLSSMSKELSYWRGKFEEAQNRSDRVNDRLIQTQGFEPVSDLGIKEADGYASRYAQMMKAAQAEAVEMFADEVPTKKQDEVGELEVDGGLAEALLSSFRNE